MSIHRRLTPGSNPASGAAMDHGRGATAAASVDPGRIELDAEALRVISDEIDRDFGTELKRSALVLYDLDPTHLQAQWYVTPQQVGQALSAFPGSPSELTQVLRLCRLDRDGRTQVVETSRQGRGSEPCRGHESFRLAKGAASYECELGLESGAGGWLLLVRSNRIQVASPAVPPPAIGFPFGEIQASRPSGILVDEFQEMPVEEALAAVGETLDPLFPNTGPVIDPLAWQRASASAEVPGRQDSVATVALALPDSAPESATEAGGAATEPLSWASGGMPPPLLPSDQDRERRTTDMPGPLYDPRAALSSAALRGSHSDGNDLEVWAELVVQGKGRPGARVELFGLPVRIGSDGRFCVRRAVDAALLLSVAPGRDLSPKPVDPDAE